MLILYRLLIAPLGLLFALLLAPFSKKLRAAIAARRSTAGTPYWKRLPPLRQSLWLHAASGEFEYVRALIRNLRAQRPDVPLLVTYSSPSYRGVIEREPGLAAVLPLPLDFPGPLRSFLNHFNPRLLVIARTDLWPELLEQARRRHLPVWLIAATDRRPARWRGWLKAPMLRLLSRIYCVSELDARNLRPLAKNVPVVAVGDPRFDQAHYRVAQNQTRDSFPLPPSDRRTLILGSTWPEDDRVWMRALDAGLFEKLRIIWVPHEAHFDNLRDIEIFCQRLGLRHARWTGDVADDRDIWIVDRGGLLAEIYLKGDLAFVGGSFRAKVHSVMEPLMAGVPVLVGPFHKNNAEAVDFQSAQPGVETAPPVRVVWNPTDIRRELTSFLSDSRTTADVRALTRRRMEAQLGATDRILSDLVPTLDHLLEGPQ